MRSKQIRYTINKTTTGPKKINDCGISIVLQRQRHSDVEIKKFVKKVAGKKIIDTGNTASRGPLVQLVIIVVVSPSSSEDLDSVLSCTQY